MRSPGPAVRILAVRAPPNKKLPMMPGRREFTRELRSAAGTIVNAPVQSEILNGRAGRQHEDIFRNSATNNRRTHPESIGRVSNTHVHPLGQPETPTTGNKRANSTAMEGVRKPSNSLNCPMISLVHSPGRALRVSVVPALQNPSNEAGATKICLRAYLRSRYYLRRPPSNRPPLCPVCRPGPAVPILAILAL